jgi:hypothetical protein
LETARNRVVETWHSPPPITFEERVLPARFDHHAVEHGCGALDVDAPVGAGGAKRGGGAAEQLERLGRALRG